MAALTVTYNDKDETQAEGHPNRLVTDDDMNELKNVGNNHAGLIDSNTSAASASASHIANTSNPHNVTKAQVGLPLADNTADANKEVSGPQQTALNLKANLASPTFTGVPAGPTASPGTNTTQFATTAFVEAAVSALIARMVFGEVPTGTVDGVNDTFTVANSVLAGTFRVYIAMRLKTTEDYTLSGTTLTFVIPPEVDSNILLDYIKA